VPVFFYTPVNNDQQKQDSARLLAYNPANLMIHSRNMPKPAPKSTRDTRSHFIPNAVITLLLACFITPLAAVDVEQLTRTELTSGWGRLILCRRIYVLPEVKPRLYEFDVKQCESAAELVADLVSEYPERQQKQLKHEAESHARDLSFNVSEPYQSVTACRQYCQRLVGIQEQRKAQSDHE